MGNPQRVSLLFEKGILTKRDIISAVLRFDKKRWCAIDINRVSKEKNRTVTIVAKNKTYFWTDDELYEIKSAEAEPELIYRSKEQPLAIECRVFLEKIRGTNKYINDAKLNLEAMKAVAGLAAQSS
jgi:hypothetical protein